MITFPCDRCEKLLEVDDEQAGTRVKCPFCSAIVGVPRIAAAAPPGAVPTAIDRGVLAAPELRAPAVATQKPDRAAAAGYPPAFGPEVDVLHIRPAMARARPVSFAALWLGIAGGIGVAIWMLTEKRPVTAYSSFAVTGLSGLTLLVWKLITLDAGLRITTKRTVERRGLLSRSISEVLHADIRNVQVKQTFWQRVWNIGTLSISSAAENEDEVEMTDVPKPDDIRRVIDLYRPL